MAKAPPDGIWTADAPSRITVDIVRAPRDSVRPVAVSAVTRIRGGHVETRYTLLNAGAHISLTTDRGGIVPLWEKTYPIGFSRTQPGYPNGTESPRMFAPEIAAMALDIATRYPPLTTVEIEWDANI
jgi:hypothetical protein